MCSNGGVPTLCTSVRYRTSDGTAKAGMDYEQAEGIVEFRPGFPSASIEIAIFPADEVERDETFSVQLFDPQPGHRVRLERDTVQT
jgi:hypothetical protein